MASPISSKSPNPRASLLLNAESPLRSSGFLTKSVGFNVSPVSRDNSMPFFNHNLLNLRIGVTSNLGNKNVN